MQQKAFGGWAPPRPAGELKLSPDWLAAILGPNSKWRGGEGSEEEEGKGRLVKRRKGEPF